jgi:hypothetical protein
MGERGKSRSGLRQLISRTGSNRCSSSASIISSSSGGQRPVVPKVPSRRWRPARPAICPISAACQKAVAGAVELPVRGKGDVVDFEVQPHADGIGGDDQIDLAGLEQGDLRIAGTRAERAQHHRRPAALAAQQFGDGVNLLGGEGDDGRARGQTCQLAFARDR